MYFTSWLFIQLISVGMIDVGDSLFTGKPVRQGALPYMAYLLRTNAEQSSWCGGGILDEKHIITAAHCVDDITAGDLAVIVGETQIIHSLNRRWPVAKINIHPDFRRPKSLSNLAYFLRRFAPFVGSPNLLEKMRDDIAVLTLTEPLSFGPNIRALGMIDCDPIIYGHKCKFAGWGITGSDANPVITSQLLWNELEILEPEECSALGRIFRKTEICAFGPDKTAVAAPGDSGGPLVCHGFLFGILSSGSFVRHKPDIFVRATIYIDFINKALKD